MEIIELGVCESVLQGSGFIRDCNALGSWHGYWLGYSCPSILIVKVGDQGTEIRDTDHHLIVQ